MTNRNIEEIEDGREPSGGEIVVATAFTAIVVSLLALIAACAWRAMMGG
jgi:hypothetical protein